MQTNESYSKLATHRFVGRSFYTLGLVVVAIVLTCSPGGKVANAADGDLDPTLAGAAGC